MSKSVILHAHLALAKSIAEYLADAGDDKDKALEALRRDVVSREGQNSKARAFQRSYGKLIEKLKLPADPDDADAASEAALEAVKALETAGASAGQIDAMLKKLGLDPAKLEEQVGVLRKDAENGAEGVKLKRELAFRDAADGLGYDAAKLARTLRDEAGVPEKRSVKSSVDGKEVTADVWGIPSADGKTFVALTDHGDVKGFEASLKKEAAPAPAVLPTGPSLPAQRGGTAPTGPVTLDAASMAAAMASSGAGSI